MKANYKNWVPKAMMYELATGTAVFAAGTVATYFKTKKLPAPFRTGALTVLGLGTAVCGAFTAWSIFAHDRFSYEGRRQLSRQIVEGTADYIKIPDGGKGLDVGCGSGALTIACARRNPKAKMVGIDRWGLEYASFSKKLCESNSEAEKVYNTSFIRGDATKLDFEDETFDVVTSNYVYHNIPGIDKQKLILETFRVLKKGGTFAIHDIMSKRRYGDMEAFIRELKSKGFEKAELIPTDNGKFMTKAESVLLMLNGSCLLVGKK